jgi:hypothetical protein
MKATAAVDTHFGGEDFGSNMVEKSLRLAEK